MLGDNIFYGHGLQRSCCGARTARDRGATVFGYWVRDPERYGVVEFDADGPGGRHRGKARAAASRNYAVTGLYFYDGRVGDYRRRA